VDYLPSPTIFAHRGASKYAPENTLKAFELAVAQNADALELDAKLCADGQIVVFHDQTIDRTTNGTGKVLDLPLSTLKELDAGSWFGDDFSGEAIPTLGEVLETVGKKISINIELTNYASPRDQLPDKVAHLVKKHNLQDTILFSSFNPLALRRVHQLLPEIPIGLLALPGFAGAWARSQVGSWLVPHQALHPEFEDTTKKLVSYQHTKGHRVYSWTINEGAAMRLLFQRGVDGIFTDDPLLALKIRAEVKA